MQGEPGQEGPKADFEAARSEVTDRLQREKQTAAEVLHDARDELADKASEYATEAKEAVTQQAEGVQQDISANMLAFGGALRAASDHLANSDQRKASQVVLDAAGGLERLASSLKEKPFEEVLGEVRSFGRANSAALIAGSVLAGLALGRFLKSSAPDTSVADMARYGGEDEAGSEGFSRTSASHVSRQASLSEPPTSPSNDMSDSDFNQERSHE